jgi:hypothetical protein
VTPEPTRVPDPDPGPAPEPRNVALMDALQTGDVAAVAFALRHGPTVAPLAGDDSADLYTYRDPQTGHSALLLFSAAAHTPATLQTPVTLLAPTVLRAYLGVHGDEISTVFLDVAGPHPMQATPADLIAALDA